ncbi:hypothetical protein [Bifidobacterium sp. SO1]|uniref:hypothetical protein n=1 Tax=Bifidobacterium sp. SO1 TaxID=2809029 RepID=UPI001BDD3A65|nr:hypothetical protein [Bifidobacterium sp. SO1]MBT1161743.1 hypothetical protein [Bifidobacterium sp. SO1]
MSGITITREHVTPQIAAEMLTHNTNNRNIRPTRIDVYVTDMLNGDWQDNGDPIRFDRNGRLLDGQHRLTALVKAGVSLDMWVARGLEPDSQRTMDIGANRSFADYLKFRGESNVRNLACLATGDAKWNILQPSAAFSSGWKTVLSRNQIIDWFDRHADVIRETALRTKSFVFRTGYLMPYSAIGTLYLNMSRIDSDDTDDFFDRLITGSGLEEGHPILTLKNTLIKAKAQSGNGLNTTSRYKAAITIKAWNKYRRGESCQTLYWHPSGSKPEAFPTPI